MAASLMAEAEYHRYSCAPANQYHRTI